MAGAQVLHHGAARRGMVAVVANGRQGGDPCLLGPIAVPKRDWVAALGTPARVKAAPAVDAVAVALVALVKLAGGQLEAYWAHQIGGSVQLCRPRGRGSAGRRGSDRLLRAQLGLARRRGSAAGGSQRDVRRRWACAADGARAASYQLELVEVLHALLRERRP